MSRILYTSLNRFVAINLMHETIEQLYQCRYVTVYYRHFPPDQL